MKLSISNNFPSVAAKLDTLQDEVRAKALASAANRVMDQAKTRMVREISTEFNVKAAMVRQRLRVRRAFASGGAFTISAELIGGDGKRRSSNVIHFLEDRVSAVEMRARRAAGTAEQLHFKFKRVGGKRVIPGAFVGNKGRTVFIREGKARLPIKPVRTIDVAQMFNTRKINETVVDFIKAKFPEVFEREARFFVKRFNDAR